VTVPEELVDLFEATRAEHAGITSADIHGEYAALEAVLARHEQMVLEQASEKLMARAQQYADARTGPRATWRRATEAAARHILPPITPEQLAEAIADGSAVVMGCPALDDEIARGEPDV
jgi:hypothetical protein